MDDDDGDRRNPPPMPSTYVTLVQLEQRWLQEKQRKQREKEEQERQQKIDIEEEKRKREEQQRQEDEEANLQKTQVVSTTALPSRNHRPPLRTNRSIQSEKSHFRAIVVSDGESKSGDLKEEEKKNKQRFTRWKVKWKSRAEETLISGAEHLSVEKEDLSEENPVVSAERDCEKEIGGKCEGVSSSGGKSGNGKYSRGVKIWGKPRVEEDLSNGKEQLSVGKEDLISEENAVVSTEREREKEIGGVSSSGGKRGNGKSARRVKNKGKPRVEEDLSNGKEQLSVGKEDLMSDENAVVSTEREREKEIGGVSSSGGKRRNGKSARRVKNRGKPRVEEDLFNGKEKLSVGKEDLITEENAVVSIERESEKEIGGKCVGVSSSGGQRGNGKYSRDVKNRGKPRVEEGLSNGKEKLVKNEVEAENIAVVSTEKHGEFMGNGKDLVVNNGRVWEKKARGVDGEVLVRVLRKVEGLSVRSGRGGNGKYGGIENGSPRRYGWSSGRVNSQRVEMSRASNLVWVRKEEGEASDANVAGD